MSDTRNIPSSFAVNNKDSQLSSSIEISKSKSNSYTQIAQSLCIGSFAEREKIEEQRKREREIEALAQHGLREEKQSEEVEKNLVVTNLETQSTDSLTEKTPNEDLENSLSLTEKNLNEDRESSDSTSLEEYHPESGVFEFDDLMEEDSNSLTQSRGYK